MANKMLLTKEFAQRAEPDPKRNLEFRDSEVKGFGLYVSPKGHKAWFFRQNPYGYTQLGSIKEKGVAKARREAAAMKDQIRAGRNPFEELKRAKRELTRAATETKPTLLEAWNRYEQEVVSTKSDSHRRNASGSMRRNFLSKFGNRAPNEITRKEFLAFREAHERARPAEMRHMKSYIVSFYKWMAESASYMDFVGEIPHLGQVKAPQNIRTRKLTQQSHIQALWKALDGLQPRVGALAVKFLILSNRRGIEVRRMTPQQIDFDRRLWEIPADQNKSGREIRQPLTPKMMAIIQEAIGNRPSGYVFSTTQGERMVALGSKMTNAMVAAANIPHISFHDIRRTISTGMEELGVPHRVISLTAGHFSAGIEEHYRQAERRPQQEMLNAYLQWEKFVGA